MTEKNTTPKFIVDEELHNLMVTLRDTKNVYNSICTRMRKQGVKLHKCNEENYANDIDELIGTVSCVISEQLYHDIQEGGTL
ncbi:hypothetical protein [Bacteroides oleiciplenus]|uniref:hypothetical protein n=1 Tax=Bacteroides oleiciplenus TaxID=626931 RepID=UPI0026DCA038|nr:hypothetical protein [Bacteroides oleiciplenus]